MDPRAPLTLAATPEEPALDQAALYAEGLERIRQLSGALWTDHNTHDPGITILELACYALTELGYRARFPIEDLLAAPTDNAAHMAALFPTAGRALANRPLTAGDYRKLLIDLPGIRNAWLRPAPLTYYADTLEGVLLQQDPGLEGVRPVAVRGLYTVLVEYEHDITDAEERRAVREAAWARLHDNRNLGEDFVAIAAVEPQDYALCAEVELEPEADVTEVAAALGFAVERHLAPPVPRHDLAWMLARRHADGSPWTADEIFAGPRLAHGFIDDAELAATELATEIRLSDVLAVVMDVPGVRGVRDLVLNQVMRDGDGAETLLEPQDKWRLPLPPGRRPRLSANLGRLVCLKGGVPLVPPPERVAARREALERQVRQAAAALRAEDPPIPLGRHRPLAAYHAFQNHFPRVYGLSADGPPAGADAPRQAQVLQLKAYLLQFDQIMANYLAQLAQAWTLFSRDPAPMPTFHAQRVESLAGHERVYAEGVDARALAALLEDDAQALARRHRFLDHLLARVGESLAPYAGLMQSAFGASAAGLAAAKAAFLEGYPEQGADRGLAYNHTRKAPADRWNSLNVSGLERRIASLLGIADASRRNLGEISYDTYTELDATPGDEYRFRVRHPVSGKILLSSSTRYATPEAARAEMENAIQQAQLPEGYQRRRAEDGRHYFNIIAADGEVLARRIEYFAEPAALEAAIAELAGHLRERYGGEGMYLIEAILLRPETPEDPFLPICAGKGAEEADLDPYSHRLHFILPAYAGRFRDPDFRRFAEDTIRQETPAHLLPRICWVDADTMAALQGAYRDWIALKSGAATAQRARKLRTFIERLYGARNVHPSQPLRDCGGGPDTPPFILGRSALGSVAPTD